VAVLRPVVLRGLARSFRSLGGQKRPVLAGHKLLYRCNLECHMCPFWRREDEELLSLAQEVRVMNALADAGVSFLGFEGGEPTLRKDLPEILREAHDRFHTSLVTNGWLLKRRLPDLRRHLEMLFVSLDGIGETHDRLRGIPGSFVRAVDGMRAARDVVQTAISSTLTKDNLDHAERLVKLAEDLGVWITFQVAYHYSTADLLTPRPKQLFPTLRRLRALKEEGAPILESSEYFDSILRSWDGGPKWRCRPWMTINVDPSGRIVMPCYVLQEYNGSKPIWDVDVADLWNSFKWTEYESCNQCALACYLEPSLFSWTNPTLVKERVWDGMVNYLRYRFRPSSAGSDS
jgi:radical SAM family uncharacterized protein